MKEKEINIFDMIKLLWQKKWFIILNVFWITSISIVISLFLPKWYKSTARLLPNTNDNSALSLLSGGLTGMSFGRMFGNNSDQFKILAIIKSRSFKSAIVNKFDLVKKYNVDNKQEAIKELEDNIDAGIGDEMQIYLSMWDRDQDIIADMVNYGVLCLDSINIAISTKNARDMKGFMKGRVDDVIDSLKTLQKELISYMQSENVVNLENQLIVGLQNAAQLKSEILMTEVELQMTKNLTTNDNSKISTLKEKLVALKGQYNNLINAKDNSSLMPNFTDVPKIGIHLKEIERWIEYYGIMLQYLGPQYEKAKIDEKRDIPTIEVLDYGVRPEKKDKPKRAVFVIITFMLATFITSIYVLIKGKNYLLNE